MFKRTEAIVQNKRYFISYDYIKKVLEPFISHRNPNWEEDKNAFQKVEKVRKIDVFDDRTQVLFNKPQVKSSYDIKNQVKKDIIENKCLISDGGYKKKILKYYLYHNTEQNKSKNKINSSQDKNKNRNKTQSFFRDNHISLSQEGAKNKQKNKNER